MTKEQVRIELVRTNHFWAAIVKENVMHTLAFHDLQMAVSLYFKAMAEQVGNFSVLYWITYSGFILFPPAPHYSVLKTRQRNREIKSYSSNGI